MNPKQQQKHEAQVTKLRAEFAKAQATADILRAKLSRAEAKLTGEPPQETGLDLLWDAAPAMARKRSSKFKCRAAWNRIPTAHRPRVSQLLDAIRAWSRDPEWKKDEGQFVPALDRWIRERRWEDLPENTRQDPLARYRQPAKPQPVAPPEDLATPDDIAEFCKTDWLNPLNPPNP